ncbi:keratin, type I cytoskeletal 13-like [Stegodyphus dumicola]|uniref:keratin, type I cytoskeletal 13-like n=1 Tax=Stegodyphus dumicola TaxID=202533 RepID=UPI0015AEEFCD|nr:keratin, type I cytoskeletal 13-like [Stegodyphus dumicola]
MDEILRTARDLEFEVNEDDIEDLIMEHDDELTTEEFQEILNEEHQETQRNVRICVPSEQEEDERGPMSTSAIKDLLKKWEDVRAMLLEWYANQVDVNNIGDVYNGNASIFRLRDDRVDASEAKDRMYYDVSRAKDNYVNGTGGSVHSPVLNLSQNSTRGGGGGGGGGGVGGGGVGLHGGEGSGSEGAYNDGADDDYSDDDDDDRDQDFSDHPDVSSTANGERLPPSQMFPFSHLAVDGGSPTGQVVSSIETLLRNIQGLLKVAADNARQQERQINIEKAELKMEVLRERELRETLEKQLLEEQRTRILYQKRLKKEKRSRRRFQEQLEAEVKKRAQYEEALRTTSADTIRLLNDTLTQELERERNSIAESENNPHDCQMSA